jgi:hypothetical protein
MHHPPNCHRKPHDEALAAPAFADGQPTIATGHTFPFFVHIMNLLELAGFISAPHFYSTDSLCVA